MAITCMFCWTDHGGAITPSASLECAVVTVAELKGELDRMRGALREAREWVERCRDRLHGEADALGAQECLDRIDGTLDAD